jgi:ABC-2 type transport system permease protein
MKKFKFLIAYGLKKRVLRKSFLIANIVIAILFVAIVNLPTIIGWFSSDEDQITNIYVDVYNETTMNTIHTDLQEALNLPYEGYDYFLIESADQSFDVDAFWEAEDKDVALVIKGSVENPEIDIYSKYPENNYLFMGQIELLIINYQIDDYQSPVFETIMAPDYEDPEQEAAVSSLMSILVLPLFILITMATQFVGVDIIEEKSTKAIETIIASVPAKIHFLSKIAASILFVMIQGTLILVYGGLAALLGNLSESAGSVVPTGVNVHLLKYLGELLPNWPLVLTIALLFVIVGTLFYLVIAALFASMAVTQEDYQQFQSPLMLMLLGGFYIGIFAPLAGGYGFMKAMAFVPIFTPMVAPIAYASGIMSLLEAIIALVVMVIVLIGALYVVAPVYKIAILSYDQTKFFKRVKSYFKKAFTKNGKKDKNA